MSEGPRHERWAQRSISLLRSGRGKGKNLLHVGSHGQWVKPPADPLAPLLLLTFPPMQSFQNTHGPVPTAQGWIMKRERTFQADADVPVDEMTQPVSNHPSKEAPNKDANPPARDLLSRTALHQIPQETAGKPQITAWSSLHVKRFTASIQTVNEYLLEFYLEKKNNRGRFIFN